MKGDLAVGGTVAIVLVLVTVLANLALLAGAVYVVVLVLRALGVIA